MAAELQHLRPKLGFKYMIAEAIVSTSQHKANASEIYALIRAKHPYYNVPGNAPNFKSSIRFTLANNDSFVRVEENLPHKSTFWKIAAKKYFTVEEGTHIVLNGIFIPNANSNGSATTVPCESIPAAISAPSIPETPILQEHNYYDYVPSLSAENALEWVPEEMNLPPDQLFEESSGDSYERFLEEMCDIQDSAWGSSVDANGLVFWSDQLQPHEVLLLQEWYLQE
ncbi:hypothetical protein FKM82_020822 [Ascaphus truei]